MKKIDFDVANAKKQSRELEEIAVNIKRIAERDMEETIQNLTYSWKGKNAQAYIKKVENLKGDIGQSSKDVEAIMETLKKVSDTISKAELEAEKIAEERKA